MGSYYGKSKYLCVWIMGVTLVRINVAKFMEMIHLLILFFVDRILAVSPPIVLGVRFFGIN